MFKSTATPPEVTNRIALTCYRCGKRGHAVASCRVDKGVTCHRCGKAGHLQRACRGKAKSGSQRTGYRRAKPAVGKVKQEAAESDSDSTPTLFHLRSRGASNTPPITIEVKVDDCLINMEVDTGASVSLMSDSTFQGLWPGRSLSSTQVRLRAYSGEPSQCWDVAV